MPVFDTAGLHQRLINLSMAELRDLADEHIAIAVAAIGLAHDRAFPSEIARLKTVARSLATAETPSACSRADSRFHIELAVIAQSERLTKSEIRLQTETVEMLWSTLTPLEDRVRSSAEHLAIAEALEAENVNVAQRLAVEHIQRNIYKVTEMKLALTYPDIEADYS
jgi:DNA-binding GntR family transcriptional regulator